LIDAGGGLDVEDATSQIYRIASRDVVSESFDGDIVVVDLATGRYFSLSRSGGALWEMLSAGVSPAAIGKAAGCAPEPVAAFAETLLGHRLLARQPGVPASLPDAQAIARLAAAGDVPEVTVFDDLADLFTADPIHDVEEPAGWPVVKQV